LNNGSAAIAINSNCQGTNFNYENCTLQVKIVTFQTQPNTGSIMKLVELLAIFTLIAYFI